MILCYGLVVNVFKMIGLHCLISSLLKKNNFRMSTIYELMYHKELNMFNCFCGYMDLFDHWNRKIRGSINVVSCPTDCKLCEKEVEQKEYNSFRWKVNEAGYSVCGTCYNKLADNPICESCFCVSYYASLDEKCACFK